MVKLVCEDLNSFVRNRDPKKALNLGYEAKIREFFRQYYIPDKNYEVKEDGQIIFNRPLYLDNMNISKLPDNLILRGALSLVNTEITEIPNNLEIHARIYVNRYQKELINFIKNSKYSLNLCII